MFNKNEFLKNTRYTEEPTIGPTCEYTRKELVTVLQYYANNDDIDMVEYELKSNGYVFHHESMARGYVTRKSACQVCEYEGRFGVGITLEIPAYKGTQYHYRQYWIKGE